MKTKRLGAACRIGVLACALASPAAAGEPVPRLLVLSAYPAEMTRLLAATEVTGTKVIDERTFYLGVLEGHAVVLALTGIGLVNAATTTSAALGDADFDVERIVFSGVAGSTRYIGDVAVPERWTDGQGNFWEADAAMLDLARAVAADPAVTLESCAPVGDPLCLGEGPTTGLATPVCILDEEDHQPHRSEILVGDVGRSSDPFDDHALPCLPLGGNVFGCEVCGSEESRSPNPLRFLEGTVAFLDPSLFFRFLEWGAQGVQYVAEDMETVAVARVAYGDGTSPTPFIAFRAVSDGRGDPLGLPGFPAQFFAYHELAAGNAAAATTAFLRRLGAP